MNPTELAREAAMLCLSRKYPLEFAIILERVGNLLEINQHDPIDTLVRSMREARAEGEKLTRITNDELSSILSDMADNKNNTAQENSILFLASERLRVLEDDTP